MEEIRSMISELIALCTIDGEISEKEVGFIKQIGNSMGLKDNEIVALFSKPAPFNPPDGQLDRIVQFQRMVLLMNVDSKIEKSEINHLRLMGLKMGIHPDAVNEILTRMSDYPNNAIPPDALIQIHKKYFN
jgi:uncharacterized tellurite resistance protein B-like protein